MDRYPHMAEDQGRVSRGTLVVALLGVDKKILTLHKQSYKFGVCFNI